jgi:hypothetical protein
MIKAIQSNRSLKAHFKKNEDALTSSVFERLMYLPQELISCIFTAALYQEVPNLDLTKIESIEFWPRWSAVNTSNKHFVEPDIFIRTQNQDIIIEAKRYEAGQQKSSQWIDEITAYNNENGEKDRPLIFIALGGLNQLTESTVLVNENNITIYKCSWKRLLREVLRAKKNLEKSVDVLHVNWAINNVLEDLILVFRLFGFSTAPWFDEFMKPIHLNPKNLTILNFEMQWKK